MNEDPSVAGANRPPGPPSSPAAVRAAQTLTFLFTDIEGSTALLSRLGNQYAEVLSAHHEIIRSCLLAHAGREVSTSGDGFFAVFTSPSACIGAAREMQHQLAAHTWPAGERVSVRMGAHTGEASEEPVGIVGIAVHKAARIAAVGHGGQVLVSEATAALTFDALPDGCQLQDLGRHRLKDLQRPEKIFQLEADGLPATFPSLRSLDSRHLPNNLPVQLSTFVGRVKEISEIERLVRSSRLVTLSGSGGCGKTRLALQVAAELLDGSGEGVWFVDLAPLSDPELVASAALEAVGLREKPGRGVVEELIEALSERYLLLVFDNCEHVIDACAKLVEVLLRSCPEVHVLATSREPLALEGEHVFRVPSMSLPSSSAGHTDLEKCLRFDAIQLFLDRARANQPGFVLDSESLRTVVSICAHLDGIPLAMELAAARLRSLSIGEIEARLGDRFRLLTGGRRTALPRQQTLRTTIDWSYESLNSRDRSVLDRLAVFAGGFDLSLAETVCVSRRVEDYEVVDALGSLVDKSLVQADPTGKGVRYDMLETIHQYAVERLHSNKSEETAARAAHAEAFLELVSSAFPDRNGTRRPEWVTRLHIDRENLVSAARHLTGSPDRATDALRMASQLAWFWIAVGPVSVGIDLIQATLEHKAAADQFEVVRAVAEFARLLLESGRSTEARTQIDSGVALAELLGEPSLRADLLTRKAELAYFAGDRHEAYQFADEAIRLSREAGDNVKLAGAMRLRGACAASPALARADYEEARLHFRRAKNVRDEINTLNDLGLLELENGAPERARDVVQKVLRGATDIRDVGMRVVALSNLSLAYLGTGELEQARAVTAEALDLAVELGLGHDLPNCVLYAALCASASGRWQVAAHLHGAAAVLMEETGETFEPVEEDRRKRDLATLTEKLGAAGLEANLELGRSMSSGEAAALARGVTTTDESSPY